MENKIIEKSCVKKIWKVIRKIRGKFVKNISKKHSETEKPGRTLLNK
jgi:hypothetical protein